MGIKNLWVRFAYRFVWAIVAIYAFIAMFTYTNGAVSIQLSTWSIILSTIAALWAFTVDTVRIIRTKLMHKSDEEYNAACPVLKFSATTLTVIALILSWFAEEYKIYDTEFWNGGAVVMYFIMPFMTLIDAFLFDPKRQYRISYPLFALIVPFIYWVSVITSAAVKRAEFGKIFAKEYSEYYPYEFMNFDDGGSIGMAIGIACASLALILVLGYIMWTLDKVRKNNQGKIVFTKKIDYMKLHDFIYLIDKRRNPSKYSVKAFNRIQ